MDFGGWSSWQVITLIICITVAIGSGMVVSTKEEVIKEEQNTNGK